MTNQQSRIYALEEGRVQQVGIHNDQPRHDDERDRTGQHPAIPDPPRADQQHPRHDAQRPPHDHRQDADPRNQRDRIGGPPAPAPGMQPGPHLPRNSVHGVVQVSGHDGHLVPPHILGPIDRAVAESHAAPPPVSVSVPGELPSFLRESRPVPRGGWRRALWLLTGKRYTPALSPAEQFDRAVEQALQAPLRGVHRIATVSVKGGSGKTTTTALLGSVLAAARGDRVVAIDANPDAGNLAARVGGTNPASVRDLVDHAGEITSSTIARRYTSQSASRLEVVASDQDAEVSEAYSEADYRLTVEVLSRFYNVILTDSGTGLLHAAMPGILDLAQTLIIVVGGMRVDGAQAADKTVRWLDAHGYGDLVSNGIAVVSNVRDGRTDIDHQKVVEYFAARCRMVIEIPFDEHIDVGGVLDLDQLRPETLAAARLLGAAVTEAF